MQMNLKWLDLKFQCSTAQPTLKTDYDYAINAIKSKQKEISKNVWTYHDVTTNESL